MAGIVGGGKGCVISPLPPCRPRPQSPTSARSLSRERSAEWEGSMLTARMATCYLPALVGSARAQAVQPLASLSLCSGVYRFQLQLRQMSARGTAEFWLSPSPDPTQATLLAVAGVSMKVRMAMASLLPPSFPSAPPSPSTRLNRVLVPPAVLSCECVSALS